MSTHVDVDAAAKKSLESLNAALSSRSPTSPSLRIALYSPPPPPPPSSVRREAHATVQLP